MSIDLSDYVPVYDQDGQLICWRPDYDKLGVAEKVEREAFEAECNARPATGSVSVLIRLGEIDRFEERLKHQCPD